MPDSEANMRDLSSGLGLLELAIIQLFSGFLIRIETDEVTICPITEKITTSKSVFFVSDFDISFFISY